jgi:hypothetical protein
MTDEDMPANAAKLKAALDAFLDAAERLAEEGGLDITQALIRKLFFDEADGPRPPRALRTNRPSQEPLPEAAKRRSRATRSETWTPGTQRGRVPGWVLELTNEKNSKGVGQRILARYGKVEFRRGQPAPNPQGS